MTELAVWKYPLTTEKTQLISMPQGSKVLTVQMQNGSPAIWVLVNPEAAANEAHVIEIHGTGHPIPDGDTGRYIGTFQDGWYVGHVFDWTVMDEHTPH